MCKIHDKYRNEPPKIIYLQIDEPEISWCEDKIHKTDIEYSLVTSAEDCNEELQVEQLVSEDGSKCGVGKHIWISKDECAKCGIEYSPLEDN